MTSSCSPSKAKGSYMTMTKSRKMRIVRFHPPLKLVDAKEAASTIASSSTSTSSSSTTTTTTATNGAKVQTTVIPNPSPPRKKNFSAYTNKMIEESATKIAQHDWSHTPMTSKGNSAPPQTVCTCDYDDDIHLGCPRRLMIRAYGSHHPEMVFYITRLAQQKLSQLMLQYHKQFEIESLSHKRKSPEKEKGEEEEEEEESSKKIKTKSDDDEDDDDGKEKDGEEEDDNDDDSERFD